MPEALLIPLDEPPVETVLRVAPKPRESRRLPELDAVRGLMLVMMTLAHLPTRAQIVANQQLGFVSEAEGFIFLSAFLTGRIFGHLLNESGLRAVMKRLWARALRLYTYHLVLLAVAFTAIAAVAIHTRRPSLLGLIDYYLAHPLHAIANAALLVYCPPLLDILPMYIIFLLATPLALFLGSRLSWKIVLIPSAVLWLLAQFGLRTIIHNSLVHFAGWQIPLNEMGAFDFFAWQFLWVAGVWIGADGSTRISRALTSKITIMAVLVAASFFVLRHFIVPVQFDAPAWVGLIDKWHLGALRLLDFSALAILFAASRSWFARWMTVAPLTVLGKASLEVFSVHLLLCFAALSLIGDGSGQPAWIQAAVIAAALIGLYAVAKFYVGSRAHATHLSPGRPISTTSEGPLK